MQNLKKRTIITVLGLIIVCGAGKILINNQARAQTGFVSADAKTKKSANQKKPANDQSEQTGSSKQSENQTQKGQYDWEGYFKNDNSDESFKDDKSGGLSFFRQLITALVFVGILGAGIYFVTKKMGPRVKPTGRKNISVMESVSLGTNRSVYLLDVGTGKKILVGATNENINYLCDVSGEVSNEIDELIGEARDKS